MAASLSVTADGEVVDFLSLGEILMSNEGLGMGQPVSVGIQNSGTTKLRAIAIAPEGEGKNFIQLGQQRDGEVIWADRGAEAIYPGILEPNDYFPLWVRGVFSASDVESAKPFELLFRAISF